MTSEGISDRLERLEAQLTEALSRLSAIEGGERSVSKGADVIQAFERSGPAVSAYLDSISFHPRVEMARLAVAALNTVLRPDEAARVLAAFVKKHYSEDSTAKIAIASEIRNFADSPPHLRAMGTYLEMMGYRQRSAYSLVHDIFEREASQHVADGLYTADQVQDIKILGAVALVRIGRVESAKIFADEEIEKYPGFRRMYEFKARLLAVDEPEQAYSILKRLVSKGYDSLPATLLMADIMNRRGAFGRSRSLIEERRSKGDNKDLVLALSNRSCYRKDWGQQSKFLSEFFRMQKIWSPVDPEAQRSFSIAAIPAHDLICTSDGPLVSVIMTAYNSAAFIEGAVRSVLSQTHQNFELLIVDDVSQDGTRAILERLAAEDSRIRVILLERNGGTYVAKNSAISMSKGEFITCHDSDDWWHPQHIEKHLDLMEANPHLVASKSGWVRANEDGFFMLKPWGSFSHQNPASVMIHRSVIEEIGYFDSVRTGADTEYWHRIIQKYGPDRVRYMPMTLAIGLHHDNSLTTSGAAGFDDYGISLTRIAYCESWARWHTDELHRERTPSIGFPMTERPFAAPVDIVSA